MKVNVAIDLTMPIEAEYAGNYDAVCRRMAKITIHVPVRCAAQQQGISADSLELALECIARELKGIEA